MKVRQKPVDKIWAEFQEGEQLTDEQVNHFERYATFLLQQNKEFNLTAITDLSGVVRQHFQDSLAVRKFVDFSQIHTICDIGTGAGFPAIPLKILYPHLKVILIEVTKKKQYFLATVAQILQLDDVEICDLDWRTFLRTTRFDIDLFVTRAALSDVELARMLQPACRYKDAQLVYWASDTWEPHTKVTPLIDRVESYKLAKKPRKLVFFKQFAATTAQQAPQQD